MEVCLTCEELSGEDDLGELQGGPMYVIQEGLGKKFKPLAVLFSSAGLIGCLPMFQANQLTQYIRDSVFLPLGMFSSNPFMGNVVTGALIAILVAGVIFGGIKRIGLVAGRIVVMVIIAIMISFIFGISLENITGF